MTQEEFDKRITALLRSQEKTLLEIRESKEKTELEIKAFERVLKESQRKTDEQIKETNKVVKATRLELLEMFKRTDEQIKRTDEQIKRTDEQIKRTNEQIKRTDEQIKRTNEQIKRTDEQIKRTDLELREMFKKSNEEFEKTRKLVAGISNGWGRLTEGYAIASCKKIFSNIGIQIKNILPRAKGERDGELVEIDLLSIGEKNGKKIAIVIEVKTYLRIEDIKSFLKDLERFYNFFEEYRNLELIGGIAFMNHSKNAKTYAEKNGLYLLSLSEDTMTLANSPNFKPRVFGVKVPSE